MNKTIHHGRNIKRFREMLGIKQEALANDLGEDWNQKKVSLLETKEIIDNGLMEQVSKVLKVPADAIRNFDEETAVINIQNNYEGSNTGAASVNSINPSNCTFNAIEKFIELVDENKKLYEQLLKVEREKNALLLRIVEERK